MSNKFCPECNTLLNDEEAVDSSDDEKETKSEKKSLFLVCNDCSYKEKTDSFSTIHYLNKSNTIKTINLKIIKDIKYDVRRKRTQQKPCVNTSCSSFGKNNPDIILITKEDSLEIDYLCTVCDHVWKL